MLQVTTKHDLKRIFKSLDVDSNGYIDSEEMRRAAAIAEINVDGLEHSDVDVKNLFGHGGNAAEAHISERVHSVVDANER